VLEREGLTEVTDVLAAVALGGFGGLLDGWSRGDILALAGVVVAVIGVIVPPGRHFVQRLWRAAMLRAGVPRRRYARWFIAKWGVYENPYLDDIENLDLRNTYVPLSFHVEGAPDTLTIATGVLAQDAGNLIIDGGPGSGKSTLLKAYGVGVLQDHALLGRGPRLVPFFVQLRKLARFLAEDKDITDYLIEEILVSGAGMSPERAMHFLRYSLSRRHVIVMLDGLDEVTADRYEAVADAVFHFKDDNNPDCPTRLARLFLTCRRQNFLSLRGDWVPAFARRECSLAPLRNSEIFSYLDKIRPKFKVPNGPENFMQAVRASGTLDLHRIPLILAMSVGLYARRDYFEIPSSIAELYRAMIREMLDRHSFRRDHGGAALAFQVGDKYRFLREFSLYAAEKSGGFDELDKPDLIAFATSLAPHLDAVSDPDGMINEIIRRSGLLTDVGEAGTYVFAHRSIQEFLAAEQLKMRGDGGTVLLGRATEREWRQVVQFYAAGMEAQQIDEFLANLSLRNSELAAYCLAGAKPSTEVAGLVLDGLEPINDVRLAALAAATMSPRVPVQELAIGRLRDTLINSAHTLSAAADVDGMLPLLGSLAGTNAAQIAALVPQIISPLPEDPRLVEPLWRCLTAPGIERLPECGAIVRRLLNLVTDRDSLEELARQDRYDRDFLTTEARWQAYPFQEGLDQRHNLVTLLTWADRLDVAPTEPNRFFQAKAAHRLGRIEADWRHTVSFSLCWPARILSGLVLALAFPAAIIALVTRPGLLRHPFGWWTLLLLFGVAVFPTLIYAVLDGTIQDLPENSRARRYLVVANIHEDKDGIPIGRGNCLALLPVTFDKLLGDSPTALIWIIAPICTIFLVTMSLPVYLVVTIVGWTLFNLTNIHAFDPDMRYFLYRPNEYVDVYDDPRSRHWLAAADA
jgi:hypothetical protein